MIIVCVRVSECVLGVFTIWQFSTTFRLSVIFFLFFSLRSFFFSFSFAAFRHLVLHEYGWAFSKNSSYNLVLSCPFRWIQFGRRFYSGSSFSSSSSSLPIESFKFNGTYSVSVYLPFVCGKSSASNFFYSMPYMDDVVVEWSNGVFLKSETKSIRSNPRTGHIKIQGNHLIGRILSTDCMSFFLAFFQREKPKFQCVPPFVRLAVSNKMFACRVVNIRFLTNKNEAVVLYFLRTFIIQHKRRSKGREKISMTYVQVKCLFGILDCARF